MQRKYFKINNKKNKLITQTVALILFKMPKLSLIKSELELRDSVRMVIFVNKVPVRVSCTPEYLNQIESTTLIIQSNTPTATTLITKSQEQSLV